ncbi:MAG: MFS transporter [Dehalococcoidia bacterium]|nr:MFS transporter [Dehalococcoidia bacterium]
MRPPGPGGRERGASPLAALRHREFRWIFASNTFFFFAMNGQFVVRSILAYELTKSELALGAINLVVAIPMLLLSPFGGVIADRFERRRLILIGQSALLLNELVILALLVTGVLAFWHLLVVVFVMGSCFPLIMPARQSIVANIVGRQGLGNAMALTMSSMNAARVVAPVLAGLVVAAAGVKPMYVLAIAIYGLALFSISRIRKAEPERQLVRRSVYADIGDGFVFVWKSPPLRALMALALVPIMLAMPFQALLVVFAEDIWHTGDAGLGFLQAAAGLGGVAGSVYVAMRNDSRRHGRMMLASLLAFAGSLFLFALSPWFLLALPLVFIADVFASTFTTINSTVVQLLVPDHYRGRVMSLMMMTFGLTPLGTVPVSAAAQAWGAPVAVAGAAAISFLAAIVFFVLNHSLRNIDRTVEGAMELDEAPAEPVGARRGAELAAR